MDLDLVIAAQLVSAVRHMQLILSLVVFGHARFSPAAFVLGSRTCKLWCLTALVGDTLLQKSDPIIATRKDAQRAQSYGDQ